MSRRLIAGFLMTMLAVAYAPVLLAHEGHDHEAQASEADIQQALAELSPADRKLAEAQRFCAVMPTDRLGAMGAPIKVMVAGQPVFLCCDGCEQKALANPKATLKSVEQLKKANAALTKLSKQDRALAESQVSCPIGGGRLGLMGTPVKLDVAGQPVFVCCKGCTKKALANPDATLAKVAELKKTAHQEHE